jgi:hypothetical protein
MIPSAVRGIFLLPPTAFLHQIDRGSLPSIRRGFFPTYRMGIGKKSYIEGKIPTWWEKFLSGRKKHESFSSAKPVLYAGIYLPLFSQCTY